MATAAARRLLLHSSSHSTRLSRYALRPQCCQSAVANSRHFSSVQQPPPLGTVLRRQREAEVPPDDFGAVGNAILAFERRLGKKQDIARDIELDILHRFATLARTLDTSMPASNRLLDSSDCAADTTTAGAAATTTEHLPELALEQESSDDAREAYTFSTSLSDADSFIAWAESHAQQADSDAASFLAAAVQHLQELLSTRTLAFKGTGVPLPTEADGSEELWRDAQITLRLQALQCFCAHLQAQLKADKPPLRHDLTAAHIVPALAALLHSDVTARVRAILPLYDADSDGFLTADELEAGVDTVTLPAQRAAETLYQSVDALHKSARKAMPSALRYATWDRLELPVKRRCCFAWAPDRKQTGPDEWRVTVEGFLTAQQQDFPQLETVTGALMDTFEDVRWEWHARRKGRRIAIVYGSILFVATVALDNLSQAI
jgi:hypothetical protein